MSDNVIVSATEYALLCKRSGVLQAADERGVVFCEACRFYCEEEGEGVCALLMFLLLAVAVQTIGGKDE